MVPSQTFPSTSQNGSDLPNASPIPVKIQSDLPNAFPIPLKIQSDLPNVFPIPLKIQSDLPNAFPIPLKIQSDLPNVFPIPVKIYSVLPNERKEEIRNSSILLRSSLFSCEKVSVLLHHQQKNQHPRAIYKPIALVVSMKIFVVILDAWLLVTINFTVDGKPPCKKTAHEIQHPKKVRLKYTTKIAFALLCSSMAVSAQTRQQDTLLEELSLGLTTTGTFTGNRNGSSHYAGVLMFNYADAFCIQPLEGININDKVVYTIMPLTSLANNTPISNIVGRFLKSNQSADEAAGAQWAIWEIVGDGNINPSLTDGNIRLNRPTQTTFGIKAQQYLDNRSIFYSVELEYATNTNKQDVLFMIPETTSALLGALGAMTLFLRRRR